MLPEGLSHKTICKVEVSETVRTSSISHRTEPPGPGGRRTDGLLAPQNSCVHVHASINTHTYMNTYLHTHIYVCIHTHTHTHRKNCTFAKSYACTCTYTLFLACGQLLYLTQATPPTPKFRFFYGRREAPRSSTPSLWLGVAACKLFSGP